VQSLDVTSVPEPTPGLAEVAGRVVALLADPRPEWPADIALADSVDRAAVERELRAADALFGPLGLGPVTGGDGRTYAAWRLVGPRGTVALTLAIDDDGSVRAVSLVPAAIIMPVESD
jgi:hypothetical protein